MLAVGSRLLLLLFQTFMAAQSDRTSGIPWSEHWLRWDAPYYSSIAEDGYTYSPETHSSVAFFPVYPAIVRLVNPILGGNTDAAMLMVSNLALVGALIMLQLLAEHEGLTVEARNRALVYMVAFPMGFFLGAGYAESLFLLLTIASAYFARTQRWTAAIVVAMVAALTRVTGVLLVGVVWLEWASAHGFRLTQLFDRAAWGRLGQGFRRQGWVPILALGIPLALLSLMVYMAVYFGSPTLFIDAHATVRGEPGLHRVFEHLGEVIRIESRRPDIILGAGMLFLMLFLSPISFKRRASYGWYTLLSALIPLTTGLISYMRLMGGVFPIYLALAELPVSRLFHLLLVTVFVLLQLFALSVFFVGGFVS